MMSTNIHTHPNTNDANGSLFVLFENYSYLSPLLQPILESFGMTLPKLLAMDDATILLLANSIGDPSDKSSIADLALLAKAVKQFKNDHEQQSQVGENGNNDHDCDASYNHSNQRTHIQTHLQIQSQFRINSVISTVSEMDNEEMKGYIMLGRFQHFWGCMSCLIMFMIIIGAFIIFVNNIMGFHMINISNGDDFDLCCPDTCISSSCNCSSWYDDVGYLCGYDSNGDSLYCRQVETDNDNIFDMFSVYVWIYIGLFVVVHFIGIGYNTWFFFQMAEEIGCCGAISVALLWQVVFLIMNTTPCGICILLGIVVQHNFMVNMLKQLRSHSGFS